jgi:hypothetical protein
MLSLLLLLLFFTWFNVGLEFPNSPFEKYASAASAVSMDTGTFNGMSVVLNDLVK